MRTLSMAEAREQLTQLPEMLSENGSQPLTITRGGEPVLAVMPFELYESLLETLDILSDEELMASVREGIAEDARGEGASWDEVKSRLGYT